MKRSLQQGGACVVLSGFNTLISAGQTHAANEILHVTSGCRKTFLQLCLDLTLHVGRGNPPQVQVELELVLQRRRGFRESKTANEINPLWTELMSESVL